MMKATFYHRSKHLNDLQVQAVPGVCPLCGSDAPRSVVGRVQDEPRIDLLRCPRCHGCSVSRMPTAEVLDDYYNNYYNDAGPKITFAEIGGFADNLLKPIDTTTFGHEIRILDFGGGDGTLCRAVARRLLAERSDRSIVVMLVDYQAPTDFGDARIRVEHSRHLDQVEGAFDLVLASAILEHVPDFGTVIQRLFDLLAPGGWFYARTPYMAPFKRVLSNLDLTFPAHVHDLGAPFWNRLPKTFGLPLRIVVSRPSIIESDCRQHPRRTIVAWLMKLPARLELTILPWPHTPMWRFVGGWEVVLQREGDQGIEAPRHQGV